MDIQKEILSFSENKEENKEEIETIEIIGDSIK